MTSLIQVKTLHFEKRFSTNTAKKITQIVMTGLCLVLLFLFMNPNESIANYWDYIPGEYSTILANKSFAGSITEIYSHGDSANTNVVSIGNRVNGTYTLAYNPSESNLYYCYWFTSTILLEGNSSLYNIVMPGQETWGQVILSSSKTDLSKFWNNGFPNGGLKDAFYPEDYQDGDGGAIKADIHGFASDNFWGTYEIRFYETGNSYVDLAFTVEPVPAPATVFLLGSGLAGLAAIGRRKRN